LWLWDEAEGLLNICNDVCAVSCGLYLKFVDPTHPNLPCMYTGLIQYMYWIEVAVCN